MLVSIFCTLSHHEAEERPRDDEAHAYAKVIDFYPGEPEGSDYV